MTTVSIYMDKKAIAARDPKPIVIDFLDGKTEIHCAGVTINGPSRLIYGPNVKGGPAVWLEAEGLDVVEHFEPMPFTDRSDDVVKTYSPDNRSIIEVELSNM